MLSNLFLQAVIPSKEIIDGIWGIDPTSFVDLLKVLAIVFVAMSLMFIGVIYYLAKELKGAYDTRAKELMEVNVKYVEGLNGVSNALEGVEALLAERKSDLADAKAEIIRVVTALQNSISHHK